MPTGSGARRRPVSLDQIPQPRKGHAPARAAERSESPKLRTAAPAPPDRGGTGYHTSRLDLQPITGRSPLVWSVYDGWVICKRNLIRMRRSPTIVIFSIIQPVTLILLFTYVFGGSVDVGGVAYIDYLMPGIFVQTVVFGSLSTGAGLAEDRQAGIVDRFRSLPMSRGALLTGRTLSDLARNALVVLVTLVVGLAVGFRFGATTFPAVLAGFGLMLLFAYAFSWISAAVGLAAGSIEAAQSGSVIWVFPLVFTSSTFVRVDTLPGWLQVFARHQPLTPVIDATRALFLGGPAAGQVVAALLWSLALLAVFAPLAVRIFHRTVGN
jgi:ABC transporter DrrB family efflux protein